MKSTGYPVVCGVYCHPRRLLAGGPLWHRGCCNTAMLSMAGIVVALDAYGPITDNAGGIAEMSERLPPVRNVTDPLDAVGSHQSRDQGLRHRLGWPCRAGAVRRTTRMPRNRSLARRLRSTCRTTLNVIVGLFIGGLIPYLFGAMAMEPSAAPPARWWWRSAASSGKIKGIMEGKAKPEYGKAVDMPRPPRPSSEMIIPSLLPVAVPILVGLLLGPEGSGGLLMGHAS